MDVVRPQPGQALTWGRNERRPIDWRTCWATSHLAPRAPPPGSGVSETRIVSPIPSLSRIARPAVEATIPFIAHAGLGEAQVERVVGAGGQQAVDVDQVPDAGHLGREDDPVVAQARSASASSAERMRRLDHRLDHHVAGVARLGEARVRVHQVGQELPGRASPS